MVNKIIIIGRLGGDPDIRYSQEGNAVATFSVATSERSGGKERTEWFKVVAFKKLAEICASYLKKGALVYVEGKVQTRSWEKDGERRSVQEVLAFSMQMLDKKAADSPGAAPGSPPNNEDDVPF